MPRISIEVSQKLVIVRAGVTTTLGERYIKRHVSCYGKEQRKISMYGLVTHFKVNTTYENVLDVTRPTLNAPGTYVAEEMRTSKAGKWGRSN